mgnify:CR=1 FL=1
MPRTATVFAKEPTALICIDKVDYLKILQLHFNKMLSDFVAFLQVQHLTAHERVAERCLLSRRLFPRLRNGRSPICTRSRRCSRASSCPSTRSCSTTCSSFAKVLMLALLVCCNDWCACC